MLKRSLLILIASCALTVLLPAQAQAQQCPGVNGWVFDDVPASDPFCPSITWLAQQGVTLGCQTIDGSHRLYCPDSSVRRDQMAGFLKRLADTLFPLDCSPGQAIRWNGTLWDCANDPPGTPGPAGPQGPAGAQGPQGPVGPQGPDGPQGATGAAGANGVDGKTVRSGSGGPDVGLGVDGDFYIDTTANAIYGPKAAGAWGAATSLVGPAGSAGAQGPAGPAGAAGTQGPAGAQGPQGAVGPQGPDGPQGPQGVPGAAGANGVDGKSVRSGVGAPDVGLGVDGDFYIDTAANTIYGPKAAGAWGAATSIVGPEGPAGAAGAQGPAGVQGPAGPAGAQGPSGAQGPAGVAGPAGAQGPPGPAGAVATVSNGLTLAGTDARLGGTLGTDTTVTLSGSKLMVANANPGGSLMSVTPTSRIAAGSTANFHFQGSMSHPISEVTAAGTYYVAENDYTLLCTPSGGGAIGFVLPTPADANRGRIYVFKRTNANANGTCTITSTGGTVDGVASRLLTTPGGNSAGSPSAYIVQSSGAGGSWWVIAIAP